MKIKKDITAISYQNSGMVYMCWKWNDSNFRSCSTNCIWQVEVARQYLSTFVSIVRQITQNKNSCTCMCPTGSAKLNAGGMTAKNYSIYHDIQTQLTCQLPAWEIWYKYQQEHLATHVRRTQYDPSWRRKKRTKTPTTFLSR
jgi:hypothetical protein